VYYCTISGFYTQMLHLWEGAKLPILLNCVRIGKTSRGSLLLPVWEIMIEIPCTKLVAFTRLNITNTKTILLFLIFFPQNPIIFGVILCKKYVYSYIKLSCALLTHKEYLYWDIQFIIKWVKKKPTMGAHTHM